MWITRVDQLIQENYSSILSTETELCRIMFSHGSDKGSSHHNYSRVYHHLFSPIVNEDFYLFELGLGTNNVNIPSNMGSTGRPGASLRGWQDFFRKAAIRGADVDPDIVNGPNDTDRIKTVWVDQTNKQAVLNMWNHPTVNHKYKIIIDDGLHDIRANINFFENSITRLSADGVYIIEDVLSFQTAAFRSYFEQISRISPFQYRILDLPLATNRVDNRLIVIAR